MQTVTKKPAATKKPVELIIGNSKIIIGKKYTLEPKPDPNAPNGLKGFTKTPFQGNITSDCLYFHEDSKRYDTCLYASSYSLLQTIDEPELRNNRVTLYEEHIKNPYEEKYFVNLEPSEKNDFWNNYKVEVYENKQFDTNDEKQLLDLFLILWSGSVCEKDEKDPFFNRRASFIISSSENNKNKAKEKTKEKKTCWKIFDELVNGDRDKLNLVLQWIGEEDQSLVDGEDLSTIYYDVINGENGLAFAERFNSAIKEYDTVLGKEKMEYFYAIRKLVKKRAIKKSPRGYIEDGTEVWIGNRLEDIAAACLSDKSQQHQIINDLIEKNPDVRREVPEHLKPKKVK